MGWVTGDAPTRAELDACITCGLCLSACPTFRLTGDETASPRGRLAAMVAVADGDAEVDGAFERIMGFCLQCRACEVVCPAFVPFGRAMEGARAEITVRRPDLRRRIRHLVVGHALRHRRLVRIAGRLVAVAQRTGLDRRLPGVLRRATGLRRLPLRGRSVLGRVVPARVETRGRVAVLAGCVMDPWFDPVHEALIDLLTRGGYEVSVPAAQTCCGALAAHDGAADEARRMAERNVAALAGYDLVVADAAGCSAHLAGYGHHGPAGAELAARTRDATAVVAALIDEGRLPVIDTDRGAVGVQDPCHLRHAQRIVAEPRRVLTAGGYRPVEIDPDATCCGAAGLYQVTNPRTSAELGARKAEQITGAGVSVVASANPGCEMQLRSHLDGTVRIAHPVELYREALLAADDR